MLPFLFYLIQPYPNLPYPTLPYPTLPYPTLSYPILSHDLIEQLQDLISQYIDGTRLTADVLDDDNPLFVINGRYVCQSQTLNRRMCAFIHVHDIEGWLQRTAAICY
jgi:hypothetical protein